MDSKGYIIYTYVCKCVCNNKIKEEEVMNFGVCDIVGNGEGRMKSWKYRTNINSKN